MTSWAWLSLHHVIGVVTFLMTITLAARVLRTRRPAGTSTSWLLAFFVVPYLAIPLFLLVGNRKLRTASRKLGWVVPHIRELATGPVDVVWLDQPERALARLLAEIRGARRSVHVSTFVLGDDVVGHAVIEALVARAAEGVEVCVLLDGLFAHRAPGRALAALRDAGGRVAVFLPLVHLPWRGRSNTRNHRKLAVFDGERAITGGMNLSDDYLGARVHPARWRDLSILVSGEPAATLAALFRSDWRFARGGALATDGDPAPTQDGAITILPTGPDCAGDPWHDAVLQLVFDARRRISIATPYFAPDESLLQALEIAARRGVEVTIVVPARSNHWISDRIAGPLLRDLARVGVHVARYEPAMLHAKCLLVDDAIAAVGSANFNARSLFLDFEVTAILRSEEANRWMAGWFAETLRACARGAPAVRGWRRPIEAVARLLAPVA